MGGNQPLMFRTALTDVGTFFSVFLVFFVFVYFFYRYWDEIIPQESIRTNKLETALRVLYHAFSRQIDLAFQNLGRVKAHVIYHVLTKCRKQYDISCMCSKRTILLKRRGATYIFVQVKVQNLIDEYIRRIQVRCFVALHRHSNIQGLTGCDADLFDFYT